MIKQLVVDALWRTVYCMIGFFLLLALLPNLPPYDVEFLHKPELPRIPLEGGLEKNHRLENAEFLSKQVDRSSIGYLKGAESFAVDGDYLYTGVQGGDILRLSLVDPRQPWEFVGRIGSGLCPGLHSESECGRPLGIEFDPSSSGWLFVCDAYFGLHKIDVKSTGNVVSLVPSTAVIDGKRNVLTNSLATRRDGKKIYFTVSSTNFELTNGMYELITEPSGRVLEYDVATNKSKVIMDKLYFANGISLSADEDFILVCETGLKRIWRYWLKGERKGEKEVLAVMPGVVDNIKPSEDGNFIVGIILPYVEENESLFESLLNTPIACKLIARLCCFIQAALEAFNKHVYYLEVFAVSIHRLGNTEHSGVNMMQRYGLLVEIDSDGQVLQSWHSSDPMISRICEGFLHRGYLYLGSPYNTYVARVPYMS